MTDMYFVKQLFVENPFQRLAPRRTGVDRLLTPSLLDKELLIYQGEDGERARAIAQNLIEGTLVKYFLADPEDRIRLRVLRSQYKIGICVSSTSRDIYFAQTSSLLEQATETPFTALTKPRRIAPEDLEDLFKPVTQEEIDYLTSLQQQRQFA